MERRSGSDSEDEEDASLLSPGSTSTTAAVPPALLPVLSCWREMLDLFVLAFPIFVSRISNTLKAATDTAILGHIDNDSRFLLASALSDMWMSSTGVAMNGMVLGIFCGQAFGAGNKPLAGIWLQVSLCVLAVAAVPVAVCWGLTGPVLRALGQPEERAADAAYFAGVMILTIPTRIIFRQVSQFLQAQRIMKPSAQLSVMAALLNCGLGLFLVLGWPPLIAGWSGFGYIACPLVTAGCEWLQVAVLLGYFCWHKGLHLECWPADGFAWQHITRARVCAFLKVYVPAAVVSASDWWRVAAIGAVAVTLGPKELAVFNSSYRVLWLANMLNGSLSGAMYVKLGIALGAGDAQQAKRITFIASCLVLGLCLTMGAGIFIFARNLGAIFSNDPELLDLFEDVRGPLACMMVSFALAVFLERIPMAMGRTKVIMYFGLIGSWAGQVPGVVIATRYWRHDAYGLYVGVAAGYMLLNVLLLCFICCADWEKVADEAKTRSEVARKEATAKP